MNNLVHVTVCKGQELLELLVGQDDLVAKAVVQELRQLYSSCLNIGARHLGGLGGRERRHQRALVFFTEVVVEFVEVLVTALNEMVQITTHLNFELERLGSTQERLLLDDLGV